MSESEGLGPSSGDAAAGDTAPGTEGASGVGEGVGAVGAESAEGGFAPAPGDDSTDAGLAAPAAPPSEFVFAGRKFPTQAKAEEWAKSLHGRVPDLQRKQALQEQELAKARADMEAMQQLVMRLSQQGGQGQGQQPQGQPQGPKSFAESLAAGGENSPLAFIAQLAEEKGIAHAFYAYAEQQEPYINSKIEQAVQEHVQPLQKRDQFQQAMTSVTGAARKLAPDYPELDESNKSPEAVQAQQEILGIWKTLPPEVQLGDPETAWEIAVMRYRRANGTPTFATPPGTSGSPSARAALASEGALAGAVSSPIEGTGTPRPRPNGQPGQMSAEDAFEADILGAESSFAKSLDGKNLGWRRVS